MSEHIGSHQGGPFPIQLLVTQPKRVSLSLVLFSRMDHQIEQVSNITRSLSVSHMITDGEVRQTERFFEITLTQDYTNNDEGVLVEDEFLAYVSHVALSGF